MKVSKPALVTSLFAVFLAGCDRMHARPSNVPSSAVWVDPTFIDCSADTRPDANRCTVYKDDSGEVLADGLFVLNSSHAAAKKPELHYIAFGKRHIYLEDARWLSEITPTERDPANRPIDAELKRLASTGGPETPVNCNRSQALPTNDAMAECAIKAFAQSHPFSVRYYQQMPTSFGYRALVGDTSRKLYLVDWYGEEFPFGESEGSAFDDGHGLVSSCPNPARLAKADAGELICVGVQAVYPR